MVLVAEAHAAHRARDAGYCVNTFADDFTEVVEAAGLDHADDVEGSGYAVDLDGLLD